MDIKLPPKRPENATLKRYSLRRDVSNVRWQQNLNSKQLEVCLSGSSVVPKCTQDTLHVNQGSRNWETDVETNSLMNSKRAAHYLLRFREDISRLCFRSEKSTFGIITG